MKDIAVIGLGNFGFSIAREYATEGGNVLAIDINDEKVQEVSDFVTYAVRADVTEPEVIKGEAGFLAKHCFLSRRCPRQ